MNKKYGRSEIYDFYKPYVLPIKQKLDAIKTVPLNISPLIVEYDFPDVGWWPVVFKNDSDKLEIEFSDVYSSLEDLSKWLSDISKRNFQESGLEVITDDEDIFHLFSFRPLTNDRGCAGLFYLIEYYHNPTKDCFVVSFISSFCTPKELVKAIYHPLIEKIHSIEKTPFNERNPNWLWHPHDEDEESWQDVLNTIQKPSIDDFVR